MQKRTPKTPNSIILHLLPIEIVPTIKPKNQLEFVVGVIALLFYPTLLFLPVVLIY